MLLKLKQALALASTGLSDVIRQPVVLLLTVSGLVFIGLLPYLILLRLGEPARLVRDGALAAHLVIGLITACQAASSTLYRDVRDGTAAVALSKPVGRGFYFFSRFLGVAMAMIIFSALFLPATMLSAKAAASFYTVDAHAALPLLLAPVAAFLVSAFLHAFTRRSFAATAFPMLLPALWGAFAYCAFLAPGDESMPLAALMPWAVAPASLLVAVMLLVVAALAYALSTRLTPAFNLSLCAAVMFLGLISDHLLGRRAAESKLAAFAYAITPNFQVFWIPDAISGVGIPSAYLLGAGVYGLLYCVVFLTVGALLFRRVEIS